MCPESQASALWGFITWCIMLQTAVKTYFKKKKNQPNLHVIELVKWIRGFQQNFSDLFLPTFLHVKLCWARFLMSQKKNGGSVNFAQAEIGLAEL